MLPLDKISKSDFKNYLIKGFKDKYVKAEKLSVEILNFTNAHPYYTQQLAYTLWEYTKPDIEIKELIKESINKLIQIHDMDYERLWQTQNQTDKKVLIALAQKEQAILTKTFNRKYGISATSTVFSSLKRLMNQGYIYKINSLYELDDPFFAEWINRKRKE